MLAQCVNQVMELGIMRCAYVSGQSSLPTPQHVGVLLHRRLRWLDSSTSVKAGYDIAAGC